MRASKAMQDRVLDHPKIEIHLNAEVDDAYPDNKGALAGVHLRDTKTGEGRKLPVKGIFYGIGHQPNSGIVKGQIETDDKGYVVVNDGCKTNVEGVYAAGDLFDTEWRQAITAAGSGCMAALAAERYLTTHNLATDFKRKPQAEAKARGEDPDSATESTPKGQEEDFDLSQERHKGQFALRKLYHESDRLLVVMYSSPTCGPCRTLKPIFGKLVDEHVGKIHFVEIDIEQDQEIAQAAGITSTPTIQMFKDKERLHHLPGVKMKREYREMITKSL
jgi:thioredoxin reductase (NADPH)